MVPFFIRPVNYYKTAQSGFAQRGWDFILAVIFDPRLNDVVLECYQLIIEHSLKLIVDCMVQTR